MSRVMTARNIARRKVCILMRRKIVSEIDIPYIKREIIIHG
jgi:hypothetical protein